jgi:LytS/YehU family sensor histidine kinase
MNRFFYYKVDHILFWTLTIFFHGFTRMDLLENAGLLQFMSEVVFRNVILAIVIYSNLLWIIPSYFDKTRFAEGILLTLLSLVFYIAIKNAHDVYLYGYVLNVEGQRNYFHNTFYNLSIVVFYLCFSVTLHLSKQWYLQRQHIRKIELEKLNTELEYLKAQINPHFLFNSINTIFFQIDRKNTQARETLSRFSEMLRYQLYECNGHMIPVEKEVEYLRNYVELQRLRKDENYEIEFHCEEGVKNFTVAPLLLIPFVENAFKYISHFPDKPNRLAIALKYSKGNFEFEVFNTKDGFAKGGEAGGIGLKNVSRRLDLLYPNQHTLTIDPGNDYFRITLTLTLTAHESEEQTELSDR